MISSILDGFREYKQSSTGLPMFNELTASLSGILSTDSQSSVKKKLIQWCKSIPELNGLSSKVARDICGKYHFETVTPSETGRNKILAANKFDSETFYKKTRYSQIKDILITGEGFGWKGFINSSQVTKKLKEILKINPFIKQEHKERIMNEFDSKIKLYSSVAGIDEDMRKPRKYLYIPSSTMEVKYDQTDILGYKQHVGVDTQDFTVDEVIRFVIEDFDGKITGFSPVLTLAVQLELLKYMWNNMLSVQINGGSMSKVFALENIHPQSPAYKQIKEQIENYKKIENKYGNMVFTGKVTVHDIQQLDKMQFMDMGLYITGLIALQWGIPRSSIPYIVNGTNTKDDTGGNSEKGYWDFIEWFQEIYNEIENVSIWIPYFGVKLVQDKQYVQDDIRVETMLQLKYNNVVLVNDILSKNKKKLTDESLLRTIGITMDDVEEISDEELLMQNGGMTTDNQLSQQQTSESEGNANKRLSKRNEQSSTQASSGTQTGYGKELSLEELKDYKELSDLDTMEVSLQDFLKIYTNDGKLSQTPIRIFSKIHNGIITLKFKGSDYTYKTQIKEEEFSMLSVSGINNENIYRL